MILHMCMQLVHIMVNLYIYTDTEPILFLGKVLFRWESIFGFIRLPQSQKNHAGNVYSVTKTVGNPVS